LPKDAMLGKSPRRPLIGLQIGIGSNSKPLTPTHWANYIVALKSALDCDVLLTSYSDKEKTDCEAILKQCPLPLFYHAFKTPEELNALTGLIAHYDVHVSVDTGPSHIAAALGIPQLSIFPTKRYTPLRWGHWGAPHFIARHTQPCAHACPHNNCPYTVCVESLDISDMVEKTLALLQGKGLRTFKDQWAMWFKSSLCFTFLYNPSSKQQVCKYAQTLCQWGFDCVALPLDTPQLDTVLIERNSMIVQNFSGSNKLKLFITAQKAAQKMFTPPLVIHSAFEATDADLFMNFIKENFSRRVF